MMLAVAYGANMGGIATLIGTPPNTVMAGILENTFGYKVGFSNWMLMGVPFSMLLLIGSYFLLVHVLVPVQREAEGFSREIIRQELAAIGKIRSEEHTSELQSLMRISYAVFCLTKKNKSIQQNTVNS